MADHQRPPVELAGFALNGIALDVMTNLERRAVFHIQPHQRHLDELLYNYDSRNL